MEKRLRIVLVILFAVSVTFATRVLRDSTATNIEIVAVFVCGAFAGLLISLLIRKPSQKED